MDRGQEALDRVWLVLESLAVSQPNLSLRDGVVLAQKVYSEIDWLQTNGVSSRPDVDGASSGVGPKPRSTFPDDLGTWAGTQKIVTDHLLAGKKINAIKELRMMTGAGLKEAKEAVEWLLGNPEHIRNP